MGGYSPEQEDSKTELPHPKFMMTTGETTSSHKFTNVNYKEGELVIIYKEDQDNYYGRGSVGFEGNLIDQQFSKQSLRELTSKELDDLNKKRFNEPQIGIIQQKLSPTGEIIEIESKDASEE